MGDEHLITTHRTSSGHLATCSCGWVGQTTRKRKTAEETAQRVHVERKTKPPCPHPEKRKFKTQAAAETELEQFWRTRMGTRMPIRAYECPCGRWHTTAQEKRNAE